VTVRIIIDTSTLIKWFHHEQESEVAESRALRAAHLAGEIEAHVLDLTSYELGNVLLRSLHWSAEDVANQLDDLGTILGVPLVVDSAGFRRAALLAETHKLTFYDACWAAMSHELSVPLVSADRALIGAGLAVSATDLVARLNLRLN
jgi:predicted nucleic acid-binding protein